jgi:hypothetical protein
MDMYNSHDDMIDNEIRRPAIERGLNIKISNVIGSIKKEVDGNNWDNNYGMQQTKDGYNQEARVINMNIEEGKRRLETQVLQGIKRPAETTRPSPVEAETTNATSIRALRSSSQVQLATQMNQPDVAPLLPRTPATLLVSKAVPTERHFTAKICSQCGIFGHYCQCCRSIISIPTSHICGMESSTNKPPQCPNQQSSNHVYHNVAVVWHRLHNTSPKRGPKMLHPVVGICGLAYGKDQA